ncbi:hypothetical protein EVG20_g3520 [Dentipellis fragilis]|uniref:SH3 domain-containing protein n=1 Tax=Dentipellis fragilis TaxID=205917 RepID=A0A4Y9Z1R1_9AGAM|nr:hypothetical protein EVG20_g3520 [Dentipellis fragilis]
MAPPTILFPRVNAADADDGSSTSKPLVIAGSVVAGTMVLAVMIWLGSRWYRQRMQSKRENARGAAFLNVKGIIKEGDEKDMTASASPSTGFSRNQIGPSIVLPNKSIVRPDATKDEIIRYHAEAGTLTRPFSFAPTSFELAPPPAIGGTPSRPMSTVSFLVPPPSPGRSEHRGSWFSRASMASGFSDASSVAAHGVEKRKVRQLFNPVLPDEMVVSLGEKITVVQSFDDGWCIVGRDSMLTPGEAEMGAVPAWCFVKPVKGLKAERPMRITSLGVTVQMEQGGDARDNLVSWSNF